ncbi:hypothetical protein ABZ656_48170, partial [Streptomyces sp. NPDC007095]|uniref:hypothetical protein n=1 Tax=Streptomyces sp. NPDC007095 TaxID=3154482 RepID=UPI0033F11C6F
RTRRRASSMIGSESPSFRAMLSCIRSSSQVLRPMGVGVGAGQAARAGRFQGDCLDGGMVQDAVRTTALR